MWTCPPCGTTNEPHRIFCSACGAMKSKSLVPEFRATAPAEPAIGPAAGRELQQSASQFSLQWIGKNVVAALLAWLILQALYRGLATSMYARLGESVMRVVYAGLSAATYGILFGVFQAWAISSAVSGGGWGGWVVAKVVGSALSSVVYLAFPYRVSSAEEFRTWALSAALSGLVSGAAGGFLQAFTLSRRLGPPSWIGGWTLLSAGASALVSVVGAAVLHAMRGTLSVSTGLYYLAGFAQMAILTALYGILTGIPLGRWLQKHPGFTRVEMPPV